MNLEDTTDEDQQPRSAKEAAVSVWENALSDLPDDADYARTLREADIHDASDRREIEETIEHDVPDEYYLPLHDAFDSLRTEFEDRW